MNKLKNLIMEFKAEHSDSSFEGIYAIVTGEIIGGTDGNPYFRQIARSMKSDPADVKAAFDDAVLYAIESYNGSIDFIHYFKWVWKGRRANLYKKVKRIRYYESYDDANLDEELEESFAQIPDSTNVEDTVLKTKEADQRQLIDFLARGENERTTAIVQAYLTTEYKTRTAIGNYLGLNHKQVERALTRLQAKFSTKQFGNYSDYLEAL